MASSLPSAAIPPQMGRGWQERTLPAFRSAPALIAFLAMRFALLTAGLLCAGACAHSPPPLARPAVAAVTRLEALRLFHWVGARQGRPPAGEVPVQLRAPNARFCRRTPSPVTFDCRFESRFREPSAAAFSTWATARASRRGEDGLEFVPDVLKRPDSRRTRHRFDYPQIHPQLCREGRNGARQARCLLSQSVFGPADLKATGFGYEPSGNPAGSTGGVYFGGGLACARPQRRRPIRVHSATFLRFGVSIG